jgi:hypothetical protein
MEAADEGGASRERLIIVQGAAGIRTTATVSFHTGKPIDEQPSHAMPSSFRFSCVRLGATVSSMSFSRNAASYLPEAQAPQPDHNVHEGAPSCVLERTIVRAALERVRKARRGSESGRAARRIRDRLKDARVARNHAMRVAGSAVLVLCDFDSGGGNPGGMQ